MEKDMKTKRTIIATVMLWLTLALTACHTPREVVNEALVNRLADRVLQYSREHPDGFTLDLATESAPITGIAVAHAATQGSHSREQLPEVVRHALSHDGIVGGWYNSDDRLYYYDSSRLFDEDSIGAAIRFGIANGQQSAYVLSTGTDITLTGKLAQVIARDTLVVGTTGDYRPLSFLETESNRYWGFGIDVAREIAARLGVAVCFAHTSWPTLTADVQALPEHFDMAMGGITITAARRETMLMSDGYLANGKTIMCRASDATRYRSLDDINRPDVTVMVNPGGLNEKFAREHLTRATLVVHQHNEEIPALIARGKADVMITEITEAPYYVNTDSRLAAPLLDRPFTRGEIGVLLAQGNDDLLAAVNVIIGSLKRDGTLRRLHDRYHLRYAY